MAKKILAIIAGVIIGFIINFTGDATAKSIHPRPLALNYMDKHLMMDYVASIPMYVLIIIVIFWMLSAFTGGLISAIVYKAEWKSCSLITGSILLAAQLLILILTAPSHPMWMWIAALVGYIPAAMLGGWMMRPKNVTQV